MYCPSCGSVQREGARFCQRCGVPLQPQAAAAHTVFWSETERPAPAWSGGQRYGGFWIRVCANIIDSIVLLLPSLILGLLFGRASWLFGLLLSLLYYALLESSSVQGSVGKLALGLRVTDVAGRRISFGRATGRYFAKFLSQLILCIGFMMVGWTQRKQGLHDFMAGTLVVRKTA
ncbi:MAG: RDD family protein [Alicyclobacillus sp.]|nr:RDD family protein [Alicyclobacillus sp.]